MEDAAEASFVEQLLQQDDRRYAAVVVPNHVGNVGGFDCFHHRFRFRPGAPERLFAKHHFSRLGGGNGDLRMGIVGAGDIDQVDIVPLHQDAPICFHGLIAPVFGESFHALRIARANRLEHRLVRYVEKAGRLQERVGVSAPHEAVSNQANIQFCPRHNLRNPESRV